MKGSVILRITFSILTMVCLSASSFADNNPPVLSNDDLIKYKKTSDNAPSSQPMSLPQEPYVRKDDRADQAAYESWCDAGSKYRTRVERTKKEVEKAEEKLKIEKHEYEIFKVNKGKLGKPSGYLSAERNLENAKMRLVNAEADLSELESQAHRKGIKPGWLRCQK
jgi:hypothetical protein